MKLFSLALLFTISLHSASQHPFNYGKSKEVYFISRAEMKKWGIHQIYTTAFPAKTSEMPDNTYLSIIDFSKAGEYSNGWYPYYGTAKKRLTLQQLLDSSAFMNGSFFLLNDQGKIEVSGMEGKGALCQTDFEHLDSFTVAEQSCKFGKSSTSTLIYYHSNGLPAYSVCCQIEIFDEEDPGYTVDSTLVPYSDTTRYIYNKHWQVTGITAGRERKEIFSLADRYPERNVSSYINRTVFEIYIDKNIGYRPKIIVFEIYRKAVVVFKYDERRKKYYEAGEITLE